MPDDLLRDMLQSVRHKPGDVAGPTWVVPSGALDWTALHRIHENVAARKPFEDRWLVIVPPALEEKARAAMDEHGIPTSCLRVSLVCPPDKLYMIDREKVEEIPDA